MSLSSFTDSDYNTYFDKIISSIKITEVIEDTVTDNTMADENETEPVEDDSFDEPENKSEDEATNSSSYQSILDEYSEKIKEATPGLVEEYNTEAAEHPGDINKLAEISNDKVSKLAEISNEGIEKMANIMYSNGDDYDIYEEWSQKLMDVYMEYSQEITDAYMNSAI